MEAAKQIDRETKSEKHEEKVVLKQKPDADSSLTSNFSGLSIAAVVIALISAPFSFCGGICCLPFPLLALILGIFGYMDTKNKTGKQDTMAVIAIVVSIALIAIPLAMTLLSIPFIALSSLAN